MYYIIKQIRVLIQYRHLIGDLAVNDIKVRYRNPALGFLWSILVPFITVFIFKFIFSDVMKASIENYPFFIYLMTAVFPWAYFSSSVFAAVDSIVSNRELIKKTYFPRQIIPVSVVLANLINFLPALLVMILFLFLLRVQFTILIFLLPLIILIQTIFTIGLALIVSSLQVILRDIKYIVEIGMTAWFYLSPVFYSLTLVANISERFFKLYMLNPFAGLFTLYRIVFFKGYTTILPAGVSILGLTIWTVIVCVAVFLIGLSVFKKYEPRFFDLL